MFTITAGRVPASITRAENSRVHRNGPVRSTSMTARQLSSDILRISPVRRSRFTVSPSRKMPALLISALSGPSWRCASSMTRATSSSSATLPRIATTLPRSGLASSSVCFMPSSLTSHSATAAPASASRSVNSRPMPDPPPVTTAFNPDSSTGSSSRLARGAPVYGRRPARPARAKLGGPMPQFSTEQIERYKRHLLLDEVGAEGQRRLLDARVLIIGAGGLGSPSALYLAAAGVGTLGLVDFDRVDASNLQRQILYATGDVGRPKVEVAAERLRALNPDVRVVAHAERLEAANARERIRAYDVVLDGTDTFPSRYLTNDVCVWERRPLVYGSIMRFEGQVSVFDAQRGPCYRCLFPEPPPPELAPNCAAAGVLGVLPGGIRMLQATAVIEPVLDRGEPLVGRLLVYDALALEFREFRLQRDPECAVCGPNPRITEPIDYEAFCAATAGSQHGPAIPEITAHELALRLGR